MANHFADRLTEAIKDKGTCVCVGIDPVYSQLPKQITERKDLNDEMDLPASLDAVFEFCIKVLKVVSPLVPAVKFNSAFFEKYYWEGVENYYSLIQEADALGLEIIGDVKRGDIGSTAQAYAAAHLKNPEFVDMDDLVAPDAITVNGFAGVDGILPFADIAVEEGKGVFVWVRASNPSAAILQDFANAEGKRFFELLAEQVATLACEPQRIGTSGYSNIGMVVGGTAAEQAHQLREQYPHIVFLVPGYGAQGAAPADCLQFCKEDGSGALISASRSIIYAYNQPRYIEQFGDNWEKCIEQACLDMKQELSAALIQK
ncbi:MAG: orotidine-5'-phosphate decarboxylase [Sedimentisphaerales bacterium]|nr:orotidine-5'-phosphate decarboxylase [Sedimentisphaerales bacterium]